MIQGVDVSSWQPDQFPVVLDGQAIDFAIIKATEGMTYENPKMQRQRDWAEVNSLSVGFYHFIRPGQIREQVERFLEVAKPAPGEHLWLDWEDDKVSCDDKDAWIDYCKTRRPNLKVGLYCNRYFWVTKDTTSHYGDALWIAQYGVPAGYPTISAGWKIHQHSTNLGIDRNVAQFASRQEMKDWAAGKVAEPDPVLTILAELKAGLKGVNDRIDRIVVEEATREFQRKARHDALMSGVNDLKALVSDLGPDIPGVAKAMVDEFARRLES